jgi:hypothetical protein
MFRATSKVGRTVVAGVSRAGKRNMGGHGHGKPAGPYDPPHHDAYPSEAYPFGITPGAPREGWEYVTFATYLSCTAILVFGISSKQDDFKVRFFYTYFLSSMIFLLFFLSGQKNIHILVFI